MIVLLLVMIWLVVLTPAIIHRLVRTDLFLSMSRFRTEVRLLQRIVGHHEDAILLDARAGRSSGSRTPALDPQQLAKARREHRRAVMRRRRVVATHLLAIVITLLLGAALHLIWAMTGLVMLSLALYLLALAHHSRVAINAAERREKVIELPRTVFPTPLGGAPAHSDWAGQAATVVAVTEAR